METMAESVPATDCSTDASEASSADCDATADATAAVQQLLIADAMQHQLAVANQKNTDSNVACTNRNAVSVTLCCDDELAKNKS